MMDRLMGVINRVPLWIRTVIASVGIICVAVVVDYFVQYYIHRNICEIVEADNSCVFQIDSIEQREGELILNGWAFKLGEDSKNADFEVILYDYVNDKQYYMNVKDIVRKDVNEYFMCEYDYSKSGFVATIKLNKLNNVNYEVLIRAYDEQKAYKSGTYISEGNMLYAEPEEFKPLDVSGTLIEKIVDDGVLRIYRPDVGMYVYQYEEKLYWIAENKYDFDIDGSTYIQYQLTTTQINNLPKQRLDNNWFWDNIGFCFENREVLNTDKYRVAEAEIPTKYSVSRIWTGYHDGTDWQWLQYFRPWYEFN